MKIEKGKFYRTRCGKKVEVLTTERKGHQTVIIMYEEGDIDVLYPNGTGFNQKGEDSRSDIISEWTDPVEIPWSDYPTWCKWVAMDNVGEWHGFVSIPRKRGYGWYSMDVSFYIPEDYQPRNFTGDWT